jgi:glycosyltransferase involved in cell wall biosynthesis
MKLSLVIPCYNESKNLPLLLPRCGALSAARSGIEVVLIDNGSRDDTPAVLRDLLPHHPGCRSVRVEVNQGYGFGVLTGLRAAQGDVLGWTHADMQTDPMDALRGLEPFEAADDPERLFAKGRRYGRPAADVVFTIGMSLFESLLLGRPMWDINAQPTIFHRRFFETWTAPPHDFALDLYAYYLAARAPLALKRFPVRFGKRAHGTSHWNVNWAAKSKFIHRTMDYSFRLRREMSSVRSS